MSASSAFEEFDSSVDEETLIWRHTDLLMSQLFAASPPPVQVEFGACSHPGLVRENNEDHYVIVRRRRFRDVLLTNLPAEAIPAGEDNAYAMVIADGMGGAAFGELASSLVLRTGMDLGLQEIKWTVKVTEEEIRDLKEKLSLFVRQIDKTLFEHAQWKNELSGMGSTLTGVYTVGSEALIVHVGDSRAYLYRNGELSRLTRDHTAAQELIDAGLIDENSDHARKLSYLLTNCLGGVEPGAEPDVNHVPLMDGDQLLLCTDGLTDAVTDEMIKQLLAGNSDPNAKCRALIDKAIERGGPDNVTAVIGHYRFRATPTK